MRAHVALGTHADSNDPDDPDDPDEPRLPHRSPLAPRPAGGRFGPQRSAPMGGSDTKSDSSTNQPSESLVVGQLEA